MKRSPPKCISNLEIVKCRYSCPTGMAIERDVGDGGAALQHLKTLKNLNSPFPFSVISYANIVKKTSFPLKNFPQTNFIFKFSGVLAFISFQSKMTLLFAQSFLMCSPVCITFGSFLWA